MGNGHKITCSCLDCTERFLDSQSVRQIEEESGVAHGPRTKHSDMCLCVSCRRSRDTQVDGYAGPEMLNDGNDT